MNNIIQISRGAACAPENFDIERVGNDFLRFPIDIWVDEGDVVIASDNVSKSW